MGQVWQATDTQLNRQVALKILPDAFADDPDLRQRFEREANTVSSLNHPHICTLYDIGEQDGVDFLVMEYLEGDTLAQRLERGALSLQRLIQQSPSRSPRPVPHERRRGSSSSMRLRLRSLATSPSSTTPPDLFHPSARQTCASPSGITLDRNLPNSDTPLGTDGITRSPA